MKLTKSLVGLILLSACCSINVAAQSKKDKKGAVASADSVKKAAPKASIDDKVKGNSKNEGLFTLYQDTTKGTVQLYIRKDQLGKEFIYQSFSMGGPTSLFLNQNMIRTTWVFKVQKAFDKLEFSQVNTSFWYDPNNAVSKAQNVDVAESVFFSDKIVAEDANGYLVAVDGLFLSDKLDQVKPVLPPTIPPGAIFNLGNFNAGKSKYSKLRSYPDNTDVVVDLAYDNPAPLNGGGKDITDARYTRIRMQHSFLAMPQNDYRPRYDDPRIGYFTQEVDNLTSVKVADFKDVINRWNLVKKDPNAAISEPVEPIVWWVENTTPVEYRQTIVEAGEKWNEAFEKAGFKNAVVMKIMPDDAKWDPADIRYNVIRWVSSAYPQYGAIGPSFVNPKTGQILGADITVEWRSGSSTPVFDDLFNSVPGTEQAQQLPLNVKGCANHCTMANELKMQLGAGASMAEMMGAGNSEIKEMHKQFLYYLILHEMGHTLGLNHNMKASIMLSPSEVNNKEITRKIGLQGSVMDYPAINVASDRSKQGDYYTTKAGPYDLWAIQFGYTPFAPSEEKAGLDKILSRSTDPQLAFGNDADDMRSPGNGIDPRVMINDMSNDMVTYAEDRFKLVNTMMGKLKDRYSKPNQSFNELRSRYGLLMNQRMIMASSLSRYVGGVYVDRSFYGQEAKAKPFTVVPKEKQKKAMEVIAANVFAPNAFATDSYLFSYMQLQRRGFNFFGNTEDYKPQNTTLLLHQALLGQFLHPTTLSRINNSGLYGNSYSVAEVMNDLTKSIFNADLHSSVNLYRQNLQTEYVKGLTNVVNNPAGFDNASRAAAFNTLKKIKTSMATAASPDEQTKAHRTYIVYLVDKATVVK
ncbi:zinc-dependent metalloprotease [Solitalea canadensis]|uniref:Matrixin n=1 Tax=Solitalea canadensis (strain ATCC 29591 / DSM 3403 / JCM 21819 / LMG 8368 / NBRC 15130 / NCIMB 12057 / USAM 9D) TaxID=929556 RepID=H8KUP0_SOLCM|nr:zinc-dependent metalloprotease [Solitalea canadensis]AFD07524.1 Matrixin [Solitalea canadensis DSM 3403]